MKTMKPRTQKVQQMTLPVPDGTEEIFSFIAEHYQWPTHRMAVERTSDEIHSLIGAGATLEYFAGAWAIARVRKPGSLSYMLGIVKNAVIDGRPPGSSRGSYGHDGSFASEKLVATPLEEID